MTDAPMGNGGAPTPITLNVLHQYVKDFSFENPNTVDFISRPPQSQPQFDIKVNVNARPLQAATDHEVEVSIEGKATADGRTMFIAELVYAGVFRISGVGQDSLGPVLMIECPRLLFPFARQILADSTMQGGFSPLLLPPIDFVGLYQQRMQQAAANLPAPTANA
jgi:preprotein translocase subunit SecB